MNERELKIAKALLKVLNDADAQVVEPVMHAEVDLVLGEHVGLAEFNSVLNACDRSGWLIGVKPKFGKGKKWSINDAGRGALLEMSQS